MSDHITGQLHVINSIGMRVSVNFESEQDAFAKMHALGRHGWSPLDVPAGGFKLPLEMHDKFDWALIGAFPITVPNGDGEPEHGVMFQGQLYKRRDFEEQKKGKKLPAAIKYSRGAKPTDDPSVVEDAGGDFKYVTLISFRGNGKSIARFEIPGAQRQPAAQPSQAKPAPTESRPPTDSRPPLRGEARADAIARGEVAADGADDQPIGPDALQWIVNYAATNGIDNADLFNAVLKASGGRTNALTQLSVREARKVGELIGARAKVPA